ncbi:MAG: hypothetical protein JXB04_04800 [Kiritimatiellae bacterium]|nr:hypothetical protein [Kiritimatiellia bacterium]
MKLEDLAYAIVEVVFRELRHTHHFTVPEAVQKAVLQKIKSELSTLIK